MVRSVDKWCIQMSQTSETASSIVRVAIVGNPNTGKSTLFNRLTGARTRVANYPGVTVEREVGRTHWKGTSLEFIDLPGTYSLSPRSPDEMISVEVLLGMQPDVGQVDAVVCVIDAVNLERNLYLASQVMDTELPVVLALNMWDVAQARGIRIDTEELSRRLKVRAVPTVAHRGEGVEQVLDAVLQAAQDKRAGRAAGQARPLPSEFYEECQQIGSLLKELGDELPEFLLERLVLDVGGEVERRLTGKHGEPLQKALKQARQRLAEKGLRVPLIEAKARYAWARRMLEGVYEVPETRPELFSDKIDRLLTHRVAGLVIFALLMFLIFQALYSWSAPVMELLETAQEAAGAWVCKIMAPGPLRSLLVDGVIAGVGSVLIFLPQIALLFFFIAVLEDCGYMARAAFLMDKVMRKLGLSGKSFVPLMSSFACAVPGVMATRVIENYRDRMVTILVAPLMSCSARLPIYLLLIGTFIPAEHYLNGLISLQGLTLLAMMLLGPLVAVPVAWALKRFVFRGETPPFVIELPTYKWPSPRIVFYRVYDRCLAFVARAGTVIFAATVLIWAASYFPGDHSELNRLTAQIEQLERVSQTGQAATDREALLAQLQKRRTELMRKLVEQSYLGRAGKLLTPLVRPLGWDWRIGVSVLASFPAREVVIATLSTLYSLGGESADSNTPLQQALKNARWPDGRPIFTIPVALSIMVFFALCAQCISTLAVIQRETNSWRWPVFTFTYMTSLAILGAFLVYQLGTLLG